MEENESLDYDPRFVDAQQQYGNRQEGGTFKEIILRYLSKISDICTNEFIEGYWEEKPVKIGDAHFISKVYHPDKRDEFINSIECLRVLLVPHFDDTTRTNIKTKRDALKELKDSVKDLNDWKNKKLITYWEIFEDLSIFLHSKRYLNKDSIR